jgi:hypothetical protein
MKLTENSGKRPGRPRPCSNRAFGSRRSRRRLQIKRAGLLRYPDDGAESKGGAAISAEAYARVCRVHGLACTVTRGLQVRCPRRHLLVEEDWDDVRVTDRLDRLAEYREVLELASRTHPAVQRERLWELLAERGLEG